MKHYFLSRYLPTKFLYKGFLRGFFRKLTLDFKTLAILGGVASLSLTLGGCSTTSETFDCKEGKGVGCKSISEVNRMVDQGALCESGLGEGGNVSIIPPPVLTVAAEPTEGKAGEIPKGVDSRQGVDFRLMDGMAVHRVSEEHLRVWIAPFQDSHGNLHEGSVVHTVLRPGYWQVNRRAWEGGSE